MAVSYTHLDVYKRQASGLANVIVMPMAFLSGSFISLASAPPWLVTVSTFMPLPPLNDAMIAVMVRGKGVDALAVPTAVPVSYTHLDVYKRQRQAFLQPGLGGALEGARLIGEHLLAGGQLPHRPPYVVLDGPGALGG